jgi:ABC-type uncharacterized transport system auxiliary subunit
MRRSSSPVILTGTALIAALLMAACAGSRPVHYYTLGTSEMPAPATAADGPLLLIGRIATPEALQDGRIRYRFGNNEVGSYEYHRWTERPGVMVQDLLVGTLRASGKFRQVQISGSMAGGDYLVRGKLYDFSEVDEPAIQTRVALQLELVDRKNGHVVWDRHFTRNEPVNGKSMKEVVLSLDHNLQRVIAEAAEGIEGFLSGRS